MKTKFLKLSALVMLSMSAGSAFALELTQPDVTGNIEASWEVVPKPVPLTCTIDKYPTFGFGKVMSGGTKVSDSSLTITCNKENVDIDLVLGDVSGVVGDGKPVAFYAYGVQGKYAFQMGMPLDNATYKPSWLKSYNAGDIETKGSSTGNIFNGTSGDVGFVGVEKSAPSQAIVHLKGKSPSKTFTVKFLGAVKVFDYVPTEADKKITFQIPVTLKASVDVADPTL